MKLCGIEIDDPREFPPDKRLCREYKDGARTTVKEMWLTSYSKEDGAVIMSRYEVTMTNRGACTFDGRPVKDEADKKTIAELFATVKPV